VDPSAPGWYPDPSGRHERRYWSGIRWSRHVEDAGLRSEDPLDGGPLPAVTDRGRLHERAAATASAEHPRTGGPPAGTLAPPPVDRAGRGGRGDPGDPGGRFGPDTGLGGLGTGPRPGGRDGAGGRPGAHGGGGGGGKGRGRPAVVAAAVTVIVALAAGVFVLTSGGGDDGDPTADGGPGGDTVVEDDPVLLAVVKVMYETGAGTITEPEASCMGGALVESVGTERLQDLGVIDGADPIASPDPAETAEAIPKVFDCLDDATMVEFMAATWTTEAVGGLDPRLAPCVFQGWFEGLGRERLVQLYATFVRPDPPPMDETLNQAEFDHATGVLGDCQLELESGGGAAGG
jgi:hypothetical protein